jgi:hypothetical protein
LTVTEDAGDVRSTLTAERAWLTATGKSRPESWPTPEYVLRDDFDEETANGQKGFP